MKWICVLIILVVSTSSFSQRNLTPRSKKEAFGKRDLRSLSNTGLQFQLGGTYLLTRPRGKNEEFEILTPNGDLRATYVHDPYGRLGGYAEIGLFHFPKKRSKLSKALKTILVSYYDWGIGFKYFRGGEQLNYTPESTGQSPEQRSFEMENGHLYGRFSLHKNIHFKTQMRRKERSDFFLDNSLGLNVDYRLVTKTEPYLWQPMTDEQSYSAPLHVQLHYGLGFGFRLKRGAYLIPGVRAPLLSYQQTSPVVSNSVNGASTFGNPSIRWFSSKYWPILFHVKYMFLFEKRRKKTDCPAVEVNDQDKNTHKGK